MSAYVIAGVALLLVFLIVVGYLVRLFLLRTSPPIFWTPNKQGYVELEQTHHTEKGDEFIKDKEHEGVIEKVIIELRRSYEEIAPFHETAVTRGQEPPSKIFAEQEVGIEPLNTEIGELLFPDELYFKIFSYLDARDVTSLCCVSWRWKSMAEDISLWVSLCQNLSDEAGIPFRRDKISSSKGVNWKSKFFVTSAEIIAEHTASWNLTLSQLTDTATYGLIADQQMHVIAMSPGFKIPVSDLDDIFKAVGVKGKYPIPRMINIGKGRFTVLAAPTIGMNGLSIVARDIHTSTGLVIKKTKTLILVTLKERCYFMEHIAMLQNVHRIAEHLMAYEY